jgi:hypothetical protein
VLILSYYSLDDADTRGLHALVSRTHRVMDVVEVPYRHLGSIASQERNRRNREVLIVARKGTR